MERRIRSIVEDPKSGDWYGLTDFGEVVIRPLYNSCGIEIVIQNLMNEQGITRKLATEQFWQLVRDKKPQEFDNIVNKWGLEKGIEEGQFNELCTNYLEQVFTPKPIGETDIFIFKTWQDLVDSEEEETYPLSEEELKGMIGRKIWQFSDGRWVWDVGL